MAYERTTKTSRPGGRKKLPPDQLRARTVRSRVTEGEELQIERDAAAAGLSVSDYIRACLIDRKAPTQRSRNGGFDPALVSELNRMTQELVRVGNNANQLARAHHRDSAFLQWWREIGEEVRVTAALARQALGKVLD